MYRITKYVYKYLKFIYSNENKINKKSCVFIIVLFRIYLIGKMTFIFLKVIHGYFFMIKNIFKTFNMNKFIMKIFFNSFI